MLRKSFRGLRETHALVAGQPKRNPRWPNKQVAQQAMTAGKQIEEAILLFN